MKTESKHEALKVPPERKAVPEKAPAPKQEDYPFYIVPPPPIPGQTGWSIVPW